MKRHGPAIQECHTHLYLALFASRMIGKSRKIQGNPCTHPQQGKSYNDESIMDSTQELEVVFKEYGATITDIVSDLHEVEQLGIIQFRCNEYARIRTGAYDEMVQMSSKGKNGMGQGDLEDA